ncbi:BTAD domain-containing putative transcriptional regulator [Actinomadura algeriensis]|uniref:ATPase n=1 Tax=Actinomadura algeriensis TaxID=1679523 RepID=A0ABR9JN55_9ACTN|nr:BTAD domain-containing putative transcriptional regulator [Actinomadura algeriensis]MBE1531980.1 putative ATPase [Actinomadura algeriensis]
MFVGILGPLVVTDGGVDVRVGGARLRALVVRLALEPGRTVTGEALARAVWPDGGPGDPGHALQALVSRLRRCLPDGRVRSTPGGYLLDVPEDAVDAHRFERLAREGARALRGGEDARAAKVLAEALGLWRGEPLADAPFAEAAAVRLRELRLAAVEDRIAADLGSGGEPGGPVAELEGLAARHPLRERIRTLQVRALDADGRPAEALAVFEGFRRVLADELGTDPGDELRAAYIDVLRVPRARPRGNLRAPVTGFVGREDECAWIARRLWDGRLVTLVGPGGSGKTRLATTVGERLAERFPGGVWLVELAAVAGDDEVRGAVAAALGVRGPERVAEALAGVETLLVLDNCEHVLDGAAGLAGELLGTCPGLRVLATSRERLGLDGEALCPVPPLDGPEAVRLFAERAASVRPGFVADGEVAGEICRRLDGLPLAIELAAARLRAMTPEQLVHRLDRRFRLLTGGRAVPRHRTLRAVVEWSWDLLDERERGFAERLAVFPAAIAPEAAERVGGGTIEELDALADRSLLQAVEGREPRFRMLETIREYARERLAERGELETVQAAHLAYFLELAERAEPHLLRAEQVEWLPPLLDGQDDLLAALRFAEESGDAGSAVRLGAALAVFWTIQGDHAEAARRLRGALAAPRRTPVPDDAAAAALGGYVLNTVLSGGGARDDPLIGARPVGTRPLAVLIEPGVALLRGDAPGGVAAIARLLPGRDVWTRATLHVMGAMLRGNAGDMPAAYRDLAAAVAAYRESGERGGLAMALLFASSADLSAGDYGAAIAALEESIGLLRELGQEREAAQQRVLLAVALARSGDARRAHGELTALLAPDAATPARYLAGVRLALGDLARHGGDPAGAERHYADAERDLERVHSGPQYRSLLSTARAHLAIGADERAAARRLLRAALVQAAEAPDMPVAGSAGVAVARLLAAADPAAAAAALGAASVLRGGPDESDLDFANATRDLRAELGERAFRDGRARGAALDVPGALALLEDQLRCR